MHIWITYNTFRIPDQGDVQTILSKFNIKRGIKLSSTSSSSSFIELTDYRHFNDADLKEGFCINTMSSSRRATLRRKRKCLEKQGNVVFKWVDLTQDNFDDIFTEILRIEDASWKGDVNSSLLKNKMLSNFFYKYAKTQVIDGNLRVCLLCVDDQAVSMHLAVQKFQTLWILKLGHMSEYNKCSPGIQTTLETIFYSLDNDLNRYEFMGSEEKWQEIWPVKSHSLSTCLFFPYTFYAVFSLIKLVIIQLKNKVIH